MSLRQQLLDALAAHCRETGSKPSTVATKVVNDGKFFDRIEGGGGFTVRTYERFMEHFDEESRRRDNPEAASAEKVAS